MSREARATVQYGDLKGTIGIDGWDGLSAMGLGAIAPKGYWPVAIEYYGEPMQKGAKMTGTVYVLAVDEELLEGGKHPTDALKQYAKTHGSIPVFRFETKLTLTKVLKQAKRLSIVLQDKCTDGAPLIVHDARH